MIVCAKAVRYALWVKTLLAAGSELIVAAFKAFRADSLGTHDLRTINRCVGRATAAAEARGDTQASLLADVVGDLSPLRDRYGDKLPQIGRLIELASPVVSRSETENEPARGT
jgi:hypothetical protein